jgi:uncharacterized DUF497 family protein
MTSPSPMRLYEHGVAIGELFDFGPGKILAFGFSPTGKVCLGFHPTRREAMRAISARHAGGREPPPKVA